MTDQTNTDASTNGQTAGGDLFNTAAGWVLFAAGLGLGLSILSGKYFHADKPERPEKLGYVIEGVEAPTDDAPAEISFAEALSLATVEQGEKKFALCKSCHSIEAGGKNGTGPNLHGIMGANVGSKPGFTYSSGMAGLGGTWGWDEMNKWLTSPSSYIDGTKMAFKGLNKVEDRAAIALYMNANGSNLPLPEFVPAAAEEAQGDAPAADAAEAEPTDAQATTVEPAEAES